MINDKSSSDKGLICVTDVYGRMTWMKDGMLHHIGAPAIICSNGDVIWCINGMIHRDDGPAIKNKTVSAWLVNGIRHREDGPAIIYENGTIEWFIHGEDITNVVDKWMRDNDITYPFSEENLIQFKMTWL